MRMSLFKIGPRVQIERRFLGRILPPKLRQGLGTDLEAVKSKRVLAEKIRDGGYREAVFHDIEKQIPTAADATEIF